ncbi:amd1 [Symbiodinium microadriaticum]|nr:amd1 [Symbiodinium microadriaticum]
MSNFYDNKLFGGVETPSTNSTCSDDEVAMIVHSCEGSHCPTDCFEGPEKTMEVCFMPGVGSPGGLRDLTRGQLDLLCEEAKCTILSKISSSYIDAYVLSESSLFVYKYRYIMKTCGTTTLLRCLDTLIRYAEELGMSLWWVGYSRKNLNNPSAQHWPHSNFEDEVTYLTSHPVLQARLNGSGHILGPVTGDHWFVYVADLSEEYRSAWGGLRRSPPLLATCANTPNTDTVMDNITMNMMMFDLNREVAGVFYQRDDCKTGAQMTMKAGIHELVPGASVDACSFTPCGYSMNAILHDAYSTIHVTPEPQCSYASYETNTTLPSYASLIRNVLNVFKPQRFVLTMFADESALRFLKEFPTGLRRIALPWGTYNRLSTSSTTVEADLSCMMGCFVMDGASTTVPPSQAQAAPVAIGVMEPLLEQRERGYTD